MTLLSDIIDAEPSSYEEVAKKKGKENTSLRRMMSRMWYRRPEGKVVVSSIQIYKIQHAVGGNIVRYKAIFVAQIFSQKEGIEYEETFAPLMSQVYIEQPQEVEKHDRKTHV